MTLTYPYQYHPQNGAFSGAWHSDYAVGNPQFIAASMAPPTTFDPSQSGYSIDGGFTWTPFPTLPLSSTNAVSTFGCGSIHVGSASSIIWVASGSKGAYRTTNLGASWSALSISGLDVTTLNQAAYFVYPRPVCADKANVDTFYVFQPSYGVARSTDGGATWTKMCDSTPFGSLAGYTTDWGWNVYLKAVPGNAGHLFLTMGFLGTGASPVVDTPFFRSTDGGATWTRFTTLKSVRGFGFGVAAPGQTYPAIYAMGYLSGVQSVYRSIDNCVSWQALGLPSTVDMIHNIDGDKSIYGTFYMTTAGSGLLMGQESPDPTPHYVVKTLS